LQGYGRHHYCFTYTELILGLQPGYLRGWLRYRLLSCLRCAPLLAWRIFETILLFQTLLGCELLQLL
jgi:hypothetical protein